jgi:hypothetical protein
MANQTTTANVGLVLPGDDHNNTPWGPADLLLVNAFNALDARINNLEVKSVDGAIASRIGKVIITKGSAAALTLGAPLPGLPSAGGHDGQLLNIICTTAFAHVVTCPSNKVNGNKATITFAAAVGNNVQLEAFNGIWYVTNGVGQTLS